jgi:hypothetical protein
MPDAIGEGVAVPPKGGSYALRHEESKHRVLDRHGLTAYGEGAEAEPRRGRRRK